MKVARTTALSVAITLILALAIVTPVYAQALTISLNKTSFVPGEVIEVSGTTSPNADVTVGIINPDGELVDLKIVTADANGNFRVTFKIPATIPTGKWTKFGIYTVKAKSGAYEATATFELSTVAWLTGVVIDEAGRPVAGATVMVVETGATATTDTSGKFTLYVNPGTWTLEVSKAGYKSTKLSVTAVTGANDIGTITITSLETALLALEEEIKKLSDELTKLARSYEELSVEISDALKSLASKLDEVASKLDTVSETVSAVNSKVDRVSGAIETVSSKVDRVRSDVGALSGKIDTVSSAVGEVSSKVDSVSGKVDSVSSKVDDVSGKVDALSGKLDTISGAIDTLKSDVTKAISDLGGTISGLRTDITGLRQDVAGLPDKVKGVVAEVSGKVDTVSAAAWVAVVFALLAFIFALLSFLTIRRAVAK